MEELHSSFDRALDQIKKDPGFKHGIVESGATSIGRIEINGIEYELQLYCTSDRSEWMMRDDFNFEE